MIVDVFTYNGESELLDLRLNILRPYVDRFIAVQSMTTFTGKLKPIYETPEEVEDYINNDDYTDSEWELANNSPNTQGASHWKWEFLQKERIKDALKGLDDDDIVFVGDCDEIYEPVYTLAGAHKLKLRVYAYYLNNRSDEEFWGTIVAPYRDIKNECLNHLRTNAEKTKTYQGWHFTSMYDLKKKLTDQYTEESYATKEVLENAEKNKKELKDFLGRDFKYEVNEEDWPEYLKKNRKKYEHLCK
uniref:Putative glycosyltransferase n=1 Tax=viral metagenome TaxID=1070528 RepID=A0A6M3Y885_9ZZZZ